MTHDPLHETQLRHAARDYSQHVNAVSESREALYAAIRESVAAGMSKYRAAQLTGLSQPMIARIVKG